MGDLEVRMTKLEGGTPAKIEEPSAKPKDSGASAKPKDDGGDDDFDLFGSDEEEEDNEDDEERKKLLEKYHDKKAKSK